MSEWPYASTPIASRIRTFDWSATPLGPIAGWSQRLKTIVDLMLGSPGMMSLVWGGEAIHLYNDSFIELLREQAVTSLGRSAFETFARSRSVFEADLAAGMEGRSARRLAQRYPVLRHGRLEDAWFDVEYAPVRDESGSVAGVLWSLREVSGQVFAERDLSESEARFRFLFDAIDDGFCTFEMIFEGGKPIDFRYIEVNAGFERQTGQRPRPGQTMREIFPQAEHMWLDLYAEVSRSGEAQRFIDYVGGLDRWYDVYVFPVHLNGQRVLGALFRDVTDQKRAEQALKTSEERQAFLVRFSDAARGMTDPAAVATVACRMLLEKMDVDRVHWGEIDWNTEEFVIVGTVHEPDVAPVEGRFPLSAWEPYSASHRRGRSVVIDNTQTDPRADSAMRAATARMDIGADLAAPVLAGGRLASVLSVKRRQPRHWTSEEVTLVESVAGRCWAEVERARAEEALRRNEERHSFLLTLADAIRPLADPACIQAETTQLLREQLKADWCYYVDWDLDNKVGIVLRDSVSEGMSSLAGSHDVSDAPEFLDLLAEGTVLNVRDYAGYEKLPARTRQKFVALGFRSMMAAPLIKDGRLISTLLIGDTALRDWSANETTLLVEAAERTWAAVERGRAEAALQESQQALASDFASAELLRSLSERLVPSDSLQSIYDEVLSATLAITRADAGTIQLYDPATTSLELITARHFSRTVTDYFHRVSAGSRTACGMALKSGSPAFADFPEEVDDVGCQLLTGEGILSAVAYPLMSRTGTPLGMLNAHWRRPRHRPSEREMRFLGLLARQASDLIEQMRAQSALRHSEERQRALIEGVPQLVWRARNEGEWTWASPQWTEYTGQSADDSRDWGWLEPVHPDDREAARRAWARAADSGFFEVEYRLRAHDEGSYRWFQTRASPLRDDDGVIVEWLGTSTDVDDLRQLQERQQVLVKELQHRTFNLIGMVRSVADTTVRSSVDLNDFGVKFRDRLEALARVQRLLSRLRDDDRVSFSDLIHAELDATGLLSAHPERVMLEGPEDVWLRSSTVQTLAMAIHELTTNAVKYGALHQATGQLQVRWWVEADDKQQPWLHVDWRESGVTMPAEGATPHGTGQGRLLIEEALPYQLHAKTTYVMMADGVRCTISLPISRRGRAETPHASQAAPRRT